MNKQSQIVTSAGPIIICSIWDFMTKVRKEHCRESLEFYTELAKQEFAAERSTPPGHEPAFATSVHTLVQNPMRVITELKHTTSKVTMSRPMDVESFVWELSYECVKAGGRPNHMFTIGENTFAMVDVDECRLFTNKDFQQQLVCMRPEENFHCYAPKVKFGSI